MAALKKDDLVLITGGCGWVGSHIVEKALDHGLRIRLAVRDQAKADRLIEAMKVAYGSDIHIETIIVEDMGLSNAYDKAVIGVDGVIHAAAVIHTAELAASFEKCVTTSMQAYTNIVNAANASPSVRRLVLTSSIVVTGTGMPNLDRKDVGPLGPDTWDKDIIEKVETSSSKSQWDAYAACKLLTEQSAWAYVKQHKHTFILNTVLPSMCICRKVPGTDYSSTGTAMRELFLGGKLEILQNPELWLVDTEDVAMLHILALTQDDIQNERLLAHANCFDWVTITDVARKILPADTQIPLPPSTAPLKATIQDNSRSRKLLAPYGGFKSLEYSLLGNLEG